MGNLFSKKQKPEISLNWDNSINCPMQLKRWLLFLSINCLCTAGIAQQSELDSLDLLLRRSKEDTNKVHLYWNAGVSIIYEAPLKALPYFKKGTALATRLGFIPGMEKCQNATSFAFSLGAQYDSALIYINYAIPLAKEAGNLRRLALAYINRADVHTNLHNLSAALKDCDTAMIYSEKIGNKDGLGRIFGIMSDIYVSLKQYPQAFESIDKSLAFFQASGNRRMQAMMYSDKADLYAQTGEGEKAIPFYELAIPIADSLNDFENLSAYYGGLAQAYLEADRLEASETAAKNALQLTKQTGNLRQQAVEYIILSNIASARKNYEEAIIAGEKAYRILSTEKDLEREKITANILADAYKNNGNLPKALEFLQITATLNDSLLRQQFANETAGLQSSFELKQKNKELELLNSEKELEKEKQRLLLAGAVSIALMAMVGIGWMYNRNKLRQQMKELELRNRIAADLHDEVGSSLSSIHMLSQMAARPGNSEAQQQILEKMTTNSKETMDKMGDIVWMIKPGEQESGSLVQRMETFAYEMAGAKNITTLFQIDDIQHLKLSMENRKHIYLIFKEAINNAVKYSGTEKIVVTTALKQKIFSLEIKDFGKGFDVKQIKKGNGLDNMQERTRALGGELLIESAPEKGTSIQLQIPV